MTDIAVIALSLGLEKNHMMQDYQSNRPVRQQPPGRFPNESDRTVERIRKIKKKQTQRRMVFYGVIAALAVIVVGIILLAKGCSAARTHLQAHGSSTERPPIPLTAEEAAQWSCPPYPTISPIPSMATSS